MCSILRAGARHHDGRPAARLGQLQGSVSTPGYCDDNPAPLPDVEVVFEGAGGATYTVQTDELGY